MEEKHLTEKEKKMQRKKENKTLTNILLVVGVFFLILIVAFVVMKISNNPKYNGLTFNTIQEGDLIFYQTTFPVLYQGKSRDFNLYLRNNPKNLEREVPFKGEINSLQNTVINMTQEFQCDGDQVIAVANLVNFYGAINKKIMKDENASCDEQGRYTHITLQPGEKTEIEQYGPNCFNIYIKDCEILEGTERYILEMLVKYNSDLRGEGIKV